jgi:hypothetical protein
MVCRSAVAVVNVRILLQKKGVALMRAKPVHHFPRLVLALALLVCLLLSAWSVSSPVQAAPARSTCQGAFAAKLKPLLQAKMQQLHILGAIVYVNAPAQGSCTTALGARPQ